MTPMPESAKAIAAILGGCAIAYTVLAATGQLFDPDVRIDPTARVLWLGDGLTRDVVPTRPGQTLGVDGQRCRHLEYTADRLRGSRAELVMVQCGAWDLLDGTPPWTVADSLAPTLAALRETDATVLIVGVLPGPRVPEPERRQLNAMLLALARDGVLYLEPPNRLGTTDGLHLSRSGLAVLDAELLPVVAELIGGE